MGEVIGRFPFLKARIHHRRSGESIEVNSRLFGAYQIYNLLAASAAGCLCEVPMQDIKTALESYIPSNNRSQLLQKGSNTFILDAYNANPSSMQASVSDFADYQAEQKIMLLGDMFELGEDSVMEHRSLLENINWPAFNTVALAGEEFYRFREKYPALFFKTTAELADWYRSNQFEGMTFFLKGSRGMKMESVLE
jgi:UDP-N-acetylmuramoyl-tripeptide--D-alanyl-D-alanine ligase